MRKLQLYTLLYAGVLLMAGCAPSSTPDGSPAAAPAQQDTLSQAASEIEAAGDACPRVLFLGDSITAGYGLEPSRAFPAILQARLDSLGVQASLVNGGLSGETSAGGLRRIDWLLQRPVDVLVLELGGNDGLRGINLESTRENLQGIVDKVRTSNPEAVVVVAGMMIPPNFGPEYTESFARMYPEVAAANDAILIPFLLDGVGGIDSLMQSDEIHPNAAGHRKVADIVQPHLLRALAAVPQAD